MPRRERVARGGLNGVAIRHNRRIPYPWAVNAARVLEQLIDHAGAPHSGHHKIALTLVDTKIDKSDDEDRQDADDKVGGCKKKRRQRIIGRLTEVLEEKEIVHYLEDRMRVSGVEVISML